MAKTNSHRWRFLRIGGFDQVRLDEGADLQNLAHLDQKLWVALACPTKGLEFDGKTLDLIDADKDGRIRPPELLAAVQWALSLLRNPEDLRQGGTSLRLDAIQDGSPEGKQILASARQILSDLGKAEALEISIDDLADTAKIFAQTKFNGDGIVPADSAEDPAVQAVIQDIMACLGSETDRSGKPGITQAMLDQFFAEAQAFADWQAKARTNAATILPLGDGTAAGYAAWLALKSKADDFFARCRLAAFDGRALAALNRQESEYLAVAARDMSITASEVAHFPLAHVEPGKSLPLDKGVNPAWTGAVTAFQASVVKPILGDKSSLTEADWIRICQTLAPYEAWQMSKAGVAVEKLGLQRAQTILSGKSKDAISALLAKDQALQPEAMAIATVEKLLRYRRDLGRLLNNYITFRDFYGKRDWAVFQSGTLYLDGRSCDLCIRVEDMAKHGTMAGLSYCFLAYCDCVRKCTGEKMTIAAAFTNGDSDFLMAGRNGVFYDRLGRDWDATIVKIVDNPISIRQAFWAPYKRVAKMVEGQIEKMAAARDKAVTDKASAGVETAGKKVEEGKTDAQRAFDVAKFAGIFAAIGLALGAIGGALTAVAKGFFGLAMWQMPLAVGGALLLVSGPSMLLAFMKLRKRNLGPILDANGWAINARAKLNVPFGASLTQVAKLPPGAQRTTRDEFAQKSSLKPYFIILALVIYIILGKSYDNGTLHKWTEGRVGKPPAATTITPVKTETPPPPPAPAPTPAP